MKTNFETQKNQILEQIFKMDLNKKMGKAHNPEKRAALFEDLDYLYRTSIN